MPWRYVVADNQYYARWPFSVPRYVNLGYSVCCISQTQLTADWRKRCPPRKGPDF